MVYLDDNGITIKACDDAVVGESGIVNGVEYTVVDRAMLDLMIENNEDPSKACTSRVNDMSYLMSYYIPVDFPIGNWDVSNVTNMEFLFLKEQFGYEPFTSVSNPANTGFSQDISDWDVSNVTNMLGIFSASPINVPIGEWDTGSVTNMSGAFFNNYEFNQDISDWDVSNVTNMSAMFRNAASFNQDIGNWDVSNVTSMGSMFANNIFGNVNTVFNQDISDWDVSNVTTMWGMFFQTTSFSQDISDWDVSNVTNMAYMFCVSTFNQDISDWDVSNVTNMRQMFYNGSLGVGEYDLSNWDVFNVTNCLYFASIWSTTQYDPNPFWTTQPNFTNCNPN